MVKREMRPLQMGCAALGLTLSAEQIDQFRRYLDLILSGNTRLSLTGVREPEAIQERHFVDALSCAAVIEPPSATDPPTRLIDVGSGAGLPGIPLKILYPTLHVTLVESVAKKAAFLRDVVERLELADVVVDNRRVEEIGRDPAHRETYDWAVARAVAPLNVLVEYLLPLCRVGGAVVAQKGARAGGELALAAPAIKLLGGGEATLRPIAALASVSAVLVQVPKIAPTPDAYPRRIGRPAKRPLV